MTVSAVQSSGTWFSAQKVAGYGVATVAAIFVLYPVYFLLQAAFDVGDPQIRPPTAYGIDNFEGLFQYPQIILNTLTVSVAATVMALVFGFVMAWILTRTNVPGRKLFEQLMAVPYYLTPLLGALAWSLLGTPESGFINQYWRALGGDSYLIDINTSYGIAWVMALFEGSVAFVMIGAVMKSMDPGLEEASQVIGAGRLRTMLQVTLPLVLPGVLGAAIFVFAEMLGSFAAALVLGTPSRFYVVTTAIYQLIQQYPPKIPLAAAMGVSLFAVMFVMLFIYRRIIKSGNYVTITGKAFRPRVNDVGRLRWIMFAVCVFYLVAAVALPLVTLVYASLQKLAVAFPAAGNWTLDNFRRGDVDECGPLRARQQPAAGVLDRNSRGVADGVPVLAHLPLTAAWLECHRIYRDVSPSGAAAGVRVRHHVGVACFPDPDLWNAVAAADRLPYRVPSARRSNHFRRDAAARQEPGGMRPDVRRAVGLPHQDGDGAAAAARLARGVASALHCQRQGTRSVDPAHGTTLKGHHAVDRRILVC